MAKAMVRKAIADRIPFRWVTADAAYGFSKGWRFELEQADVFHVMATTRHDTVVTRWSIDHPVHDLFPGLPRGKKAGMLLLRRRAHGPRRAPTGCVEVVALAPGRPPAPGSSPQRPPSRGDSHHIADRPADTTLDELIKIAAAGGPWRNASRPRSRSAAWTTTRSAATPAAPPHDPRHGRPRLPYRPARPRTRRRQSRNGSSHLIHYSVAEIRRLIHRLTHRWPTPVDHILHWSNMAPQTAASSTRQSHYKRRGHSP